MNTSPQLISKHELYRLDRTLGLPEYVKSAELSDLTMPESSDRFQPHNYADPIRKEYPLHNKSAVWLSAVQFYKSSFDHDGASQSANANSFISESWRLEVESRIKTAAEFFQMSNDIDQLKLRLQPKQAAELSDDYFGLVVREGDKKYRTIPLTNRNDVKTAVETFLRLRQSLTFNERHELAGKILDKAAEYACNVAEHYEPLRPSAGRGTCSHEQAVATVRARSIAMGPVKRAGESQQIVTELAEKLSLNPAAVNRPGFLEKLAETLDRVDRDSRLQLTLPEDSLFQTDEAGLQAQELQFAKLASGNVYRKHDLMSVSLAAIRDVMGDKFIDQISTAGVSVNPEKMAAEMNTLSVGRSRLLEDVLQHA